MRFKTYLPRIYCSVFNDLKTLWLLTLESVFGKFTSIHSDDNGSHISRETLMIYSHTQKQLTRVNKPELSVFLLRIKLKKNFPHVIYLFYGISFYLADQRVFELIGSFVSNTGYSYIILGYNSPAPLLN